MKPNIVSAKVVDAQVVIAQVVIAQVVIAQVVIAQVVSAYDSWQVRTHKGRGPAEEAPYLLIKNINIKLALFKINIYPVYR